MNTVHTTANPLATGADELERLALEEVVKRRRFGNPVTALVAPVGAADLAIAMAKLGARVTLGDEAAMADRARTLAAAAGFDDELAFSPLDFQHLEDDLSGEPFDLVVIRRGLCGVPYEDARRFVHQMLLRLKIGGKLYVSILGLHSELGDGYAGAEQGLSERFCSLAPAMAKKYDLHRSVCLYSERNLFTLLLEAGGSVLRTFTTTHGNVKGIAVRV